MITCKSNHVIGIILLLCLVFIGSNYLYEYLAIDKKLFSQSVPTAEVSSTEIKEVDTHKQSIILKDLPELILVNKSLRLGKEYEPIDLIPIKGVYLREAAATALINMLSAAQIEGINDIVAYSGYRSYEVQSAVYYNKIASLRSKYGESAEMAASKLVAPPGASEHQTGLAVDLTLKNFLDYEYVLNYDFAETMQGQWLQKNAWKYGFILRYGEDKESKTNISYEPWHFRYVGLEHAKAIYERNICLEEYLDQHTFE